MGHVETEVLAAGREAAARHDWVSAYQLLHEASAAEQMTAEDYEALGEASWWTARLESAIEARERAHTAFLAEGRTRKASLTALALAKDYFAKGSPPVGMGWVNRAERLLDGEDCVELGHLRRMQTVMAQEGTHDFEEAHRKACEALEIGNRFGDKDLIAMAIHDQGRALVSMGKVAEGWNLMDEATVAAVGEELSPYVTAVIYCNTIVACKELADYQRAGDWSDAARRWCERQSIAGFPGMCRVYRSHVMMMRGSWPDAEKEARAASEELQSFNQTYAAEAFYEIGLIRMRMGDEASAEEAFRRAHGLGRDPQPGLALLQMRRGQTEGCVASLERSLADTPADLDRAPLLGALVEALVEVGDHDRARVATRELQEIATTYGSPALQAEAACASGLVALAEEDVERAHKEFRSGMRFWRQVEAPYEAGRAQVHLATVCELAGDRNAATLERQSAKATFEKLGAVKDALDLSSHLKDEVGLPGSSEKDSWTFMFTDIVGSTDLVGAIGDEAWDELASWHDKTLRGLFAAHGGNEIDHAGDGFFVCFDKTRSAVECAAEIQNRLLQQRRAQGFAPRVRIGLHRTEAMRGGGGYKGKGVHAAARIAALAEGGQILASVSTLAGGKQRFPVTDPWEVELKGIKEPVEVSEIRWR